MSKKHYLSILAVFNNESHIMREWIQHYIAEGVDFFYLINNFSTDTDLFSPIIHEYHSYLQLTDTCIPNEQCVFAQLQIYNYVINHHIKGNTEWLLMIDFDEFMYASAQNSTLKQELQSLDENVACVRVPWKMFGSNEYITQPKSVVKHFCKQQSYDVSVPMHIKNIFKLDCMTQFNIHEIFLHPDYIARNSKGENATNYSIYQSEDNIAEAKIQLNHYFLQSHDYWHNNKLKRDYQNLCKETLINHTSQHFTEGNVIMNNVTDNDLYLKHKTLHDAIDAM